MRGSLAVDRNIYRGVRGLFSGNRGHRRYRINLCHGFNAGTAGAPAKDAAGLLAPPHIILVTVKDRTIWLPFSKARLWPAVGRSGPLGSARF